MNLYDKIRCQDNEVIEGNIYLFINWFRFNLEHAGLSHYFETETHLSLAKKIQFQLETNLDNSHNFIFNYLKSKLYSSVDPIFKDYDLCIDLLNAINDIHNGTHKSGGDIKGIVSGDCFQNEVRDLIQELEQTYLNDLLDNLLSLLYSEDLVADKFENLKYTTNLIVSYFLFQGYSYLDLDESFFIAANFPPKIGIENENSQIKIYRAEEIIEYFHLLNDKDETWFTFFVPIKGLDYNSEEILRYNTVEFIPKSNKDMTHLLDWAAYRYENWHIDISAVTLLCKTKVLSRSIYSAKQRAIEAFKSEIEYLNISLCSESKMLEEFFIGYEIENNLINFGKGRMREIDTFNIEIFRNNPFEFYRNESTDIKERVKRFELLFIASINEPSSYREISSLWHYLEVLFYKWKKKNELKSLVSYLLLLNENAFNLKSQLRQSVFDLLENERYWDLGIDDHETQEKLFKSSRIDIDLFLSKIDNPFVQILINEYDKFDTQENLPEAQDYYFRIMDEIYSVRNSFLHSGSVNEFSIIKLKHITPLIISRIRNLLHSEINRDGQFESTVHFLYASAQKLI